MEKIIRKGLIIKMAMVLISALFAVLLMVKISTASGLVFYVYPSGDTSGETDRANIMAAFDQAKAAGDGSIVQLGAGTFHVNRPLFVEDFVGTFRGAGKGLTTIKTTPTGFSGAPPFGDAAPIVLNMWLKDRGASPTDTTNLTVEHMTIHATGETQGFYQDGYGPYHGFYGMVLDGRYELTQEPGRLKLKVLPAYQNVKVSEVSVEGDNLIDAIIIEGGLGGYMEGNQVTTVPSFYEYLRGKIEISDCDVDSSGFSTYMTLWTKDSTVIIKDSTIKGSPTAGVYLAHAVNTSFDVSRLKTVNSSGVSTRKTQSCTLSVSHCDINQPVDASYAGVEIWDNGSNYNIITRNKIHSEDSFLWGPIFAEGMQNGVITNNKITGKGPTAIYLGVYNWYPGSVTLVGNNLAKWETTFNPSGVPSAPIWLGPYITDSTVVGGNNKVNVYDEPEYDYSYPDWLNHPLFDANGNAQTYDENGDIVPKNNIFTGVNNMHLNIGQDVREAMRQKVEAKKMIMSRGGR